MFLRISIVLLIVLMASGCMSIGYKCPIGDDMGLTTMWGAPFDFTIGAAIIKDNNSSGNWSKKANTGLGLFLVDLLILEIMIHHKPSNRDEHAYGTAIRLSPNFTEAYYNRGIVYARKGELDSSLKSKLEPVINEINAKLAEQEKQGDAEVPEEKK